MIPKDENGFYIWEPYEDPSEECPPLCVPQVVQVIEGMVWVTMSMQQWTVAEAMQYGRFTEQVNVPGLGD